MLYGVDSCQKINFLRHGESFEFGIPVTRHSPSANPKISFLTLILRKFPSQLLQVETHGATQQPSPSEGLAGEGNLFKLLAAEILKRETDPRKPFLRVYPT